METPASVRPLRWAISEPTSISPQDVVTSEDLLVADALFDSLTAWDEDLSIRAEVARGWTASDDARTWTFRLRDDVTFADGARVDAAAFVRGWTATAGSGAASHHLRPVDGYAALRSGRSATLWGVEAVDARTLRVRLRWPLADFPAVAAHPALAPLPPAYEAGPEGFAEQPVGNGAFRMAEPWARGQFIRLRRREDAPDPGGEGVPAAEVVFQFLEPSAAGVALEQERVDVTAVPVGDMEPMASERSARLGRYAGPGLLRGDTATTYLLVADTRDPPFDDPDVRRAVSRAINRERLAGDVFDGGARPALTTVPGVIPGGRDRACPACVTDTAGAAAVFAANGVTRMDLWFDRAGGHGPVARRIQADLRAAGVAVVLREVPYDEYRAAVEEGRPGLYRFGWTLDYPTLDNGLYPLLHSASTPESGGANVARYNDAEVDRLLDRGRGTLDPVARRRLYQRAEDIAIDRDQAVVPLVTYRHRLVVGPRVLELVHGPLRSTDLAAVRLSEAP